MQDSLERGGTETSLPPAKPQHLRPSGKPRIVKQTDDFVVVNKPAHLLIHPTRPDGQYTLLDWLKSQFPDRQLSLVNRLDRETSGLVLVALRAEAASLLGQMTMRREIGKEYLAVVHGRPVPERGEIDAPLGRLGLTEMNAIYLKQTVRADGAPAQTHYQTIAAGSDFSLLKVQTKTGRLHQIRVHLAHIGNPVIGDKLYGPDSNFYLKFIAEGWTTELEKALFLDHHALHAHSLSFAWNGETVHCQYPLSDDVADFVLARIPGAESLLLV